MSLVSVIMPAFEADATIVRAVSSALAQTHRELEVVVIADDGRDYARVLGDAGVRDARVRHLTSGMVGGGAPRTRNIGLADARGDFITLLDADDLMRPEKLARLLPLANRHGAAFDNIAVVDDRTGAEVYRAFQAPVPGLLDVETFFTLDTPIVGVMRRDQAEPQDETIAVAEDVIMNLRLIDNLGTVALVPDVLSEYRIVPTSLCNDGHATERFELAYTRILELLPSIPLSPTTRAQAIAGFTAKRDLNRAYAAARAQSPALSFQDFVASRRR